MHNHLKAFLILITVTLSLNAAVSYEIQYMNGVSRSISDKAIQQTIDDALKLEMAKNPYGKAIVHVYQNNYVVYLTRSDIYYAASFKLELNNSKVTRVINDYIEENTQDLSVCGVCQDTTVEAVASNSSPEYPTAVTMVDSVYKIFQQAGLKTVKLVKEQESLTAITNYLKCPKLKIWTRVGHGNSGGALLGDGKSLTAASINALPANSLKNKNLHLNSCELHQGAFEQAILGKGAYTYAGGDVMLNMGPSEKATMAHMINIIIKKQEIKQSLDALVKSSKEGFGISGSGSSPWYFYSSTSIANQNMQTIQNSFGLSIGQGKILFINNMPRTATSKISIFDINGSLLYQKSALQSNEWTMINSSGQKVSAGSYIAVLSDENGINMKKAFTIVK